MTTEHMIPECFDVGSDYRLPDGPHEPACWPVTEALRKIAAHLAEHPDVDMVSVWEEPTFSASAVGVSIVIAWKTADDRLTNVLGREARQAIGEEIQRQFPDWTWMDGNWTTMLPWQEQIAWIKDRWGRPY